MTTPARAQTQRAIASPGFVELHGGDSCVVLVPGLGGKIRDITLAGRQWLWHNPDVPFTLPAAQAEPTPPADSGGFDDLFPTLRECLIPTWVQGVRNRQLPEGGELWVEQPEFSVAADEHGPSATCRWTGIAMPYELSRTVTVRMDGSVTFSYALKNGGTHRLPFLWASWPVLPLTQHTRIVLPEGARTRLLSQHGIAIGRAGSEHRWPRLRVGSSLVDLAQPALSLQDEYAVKLFVDLPRNEALVALEEENVRLEMHLNGRDIPNVGVWIDRRGSPPPTVARRWGVPLLQAKSSRSKMNVVLGPCRGAPDSLSDALGTWDDAHWVEAGATSRWSMTWRGVRIEAA